MKVIFRIEKKEKGYSVEFESLDTPQLENGAPDVEEYRKVWNIILDQATSMVNSLSNIKR